MDVISARKKFAKLSVRFKATFHRNLSEFWDIRTPYGIATGFDLIKFDREVLKSRRSMEAAVRAKYGNDAVNLVKELIGG